MQNTANSNASKTYCLQVGREASDHRLTALLRVDCYQVTNACYVRHPLQREPDFGVVSVNYDLNDLLTRAEPPI